MLRTVLSTASESNAPGNTPEMLLVGIGVAVCCVVLPATALRKCVVGLVSAVGHARVVWQGFMASPMLNSRCFSHKCCFWRCRSGRPSGRRWQSEAAATSCERWASQYMTVVECGGNWGCSEAAVLAWRDSAVGLCISQFLCLTAVCVVTVGLHCHCALLVLCVAEMCVSDNATDDTQALDCGCCRFDLNGSAHGHAFPLLFFRSCVRRL